MNDVTVGCLRHGRGICDLYCARSLAGVVHPARQFYARSEELSVNSSIPENENRIFP